MADTSFETELSSLTDKLVNVTIGDNIESTNGDWENVLSLIKERKSKKQACDVDTLKNESFKRFHLDEVSFTSCMSKLKEMNHIKEIKRKGKVTFSLLTVDAPPFEPSGEVEQTQTFTESDHDDYVDFKKYVTESIGILDRKIDKYQANFEIKDAVIKLLKEELLNTQESLKIALQQNSDLIKRISLSSDCSNENHNFICSQDTSRDNLQIDDINNENNLSQIINDIPFDKSINYYDDPLKDLSVADQLEKVRTKQRNTYISSTQKKSNLKQLKDDSQKAVKVSEKSEAQKSKSKANSEKVRNEVVICGDSMLNNIVGNGVSTKFTRSLVRSFPGADSDDMLDYLKPILTKKKPRYLILHVGTNDITSGCDTSKNLERIRDLVIEISPNTELIISNVIVRDDKNATKDMKNEVKLKNELLSKFCERFNLHLINHDNIGKNMFSIKKLHLNGNGISKLAQNLKLFITENCC